MKGLELSRAFYEQYGEPMLRAQFPAALPLLAVGLLGSGSECFGFDDEVSQDHDFEPGFCIFLPGEDALDRRTAFQLERAYAKLPKEFEGFRRPMMLPVGGARRGVLRTGEFFTEKVGAPDGVLTLGQWLTVPEQALAEATNGELYFDGPGEVTAIRARLAYFPEDVRLKRLAGQLLLMAQAGQYNYARILRHGEPAAAQLAVCAFVRSAMAAIFLLNRRYQPYYKWSFRALRALPLLAGQTQTLEWLLTTDNAPARAREKLDAIENVAAAVIDELLAQELTRANCGDLEKHAYSVNDRVEDAALRNEHILAAV